MESLMSVEPIFAKKSSWTHTTFQRSNFGVICLNVTLFFGKTDKSHLANITSKWLLMRMVQPNVDTQVVPTFALLQTIFKSA